MRERYDTIQQGDVFALNDPYHGGTHLPDITVITPIFDLQGKKYPLLCGQPCTPCRYRWYHPGFHASA